MTAKCGSLHSKYSPDLQAGVFYNRGLFVEDQSDAVDRFICTYQPRVIEEVRLIDRLGWRPPVDELYFLRNNWEILSRQAGSSYLQTSRPKSTVLITARSMFLLKTSISDGV